jgi:phosphatidylglycerophosphate synthase
LSDFTRAAAVASRWLACVLPAAACASVAVRSLAPLALLGPLTLALLVHKLRAFGSPRSALPNVITALRVMLTSALALFVREPTWQALVVVVVFVSDGLDGLLARKLGAASLQGAHFDMESDGFLVLTVCSLLASRGVGLWVLVGGLLRYAFVLVTAVFPSRGEAPRSRLGRYAFAGALAGYVLALLAPPELAAAPALAGTLVLCASFGRSFWWSFR